MSNKIITPCVGICSTSIAGNVCRGCKRYAHEVIRWNSYTENERRIVWQRLAGFRITLVGKWFEVEDREKLRQQLQLRKIKFNPDLDPLAWVYDLLRAGASQIQDLASYGLRARPEAKGHSLVSINEVIEQDYYALSEAHYQRYFEQKPSPPLSS